MVCVYPQLERSNLEMSTYSARLAEHQQASVELKRCQTEVGHLRRTVSDLEWERGLWERGRVEKRGERERLMGEVGDLRKKLEDAGQRVGVAERTGRQERQAREMAER